MQIPYSDLNADQNLDRTYTYALCTDNCMSNQSSHICFPRFSKYEGHVSYIRYFINIFTAGNQMYLFYNHFDSNVNCLSNTPKRNLMGLNIIKFLNLFAYRASGDTTLP